jgi:hypothetical protein
MKVITQRRFYGKGLYLLDKLKYTSDH